MSDNDETLAELDELVRLNAPRMFALYGVFRENLLDEDDLRFVGWGFEFDDPTYAVMWDTGGDTWRSDSAAKILRRHDTMADARLVWFDGSTHPAGLGGDI